jgi:uncharacterized phage protein (TIGR01671 family)
MREFKFRMWEENEKCMVSWSELQYQWESEGYSENHFLQDHFVMMQYTGLKDKNGKEIYEGDVVKEGNSEGQVDYIDDGFYISWVVNKDFWSSTLKHHAQSLEVIGNIYEIIKEEGQ